MSSCPLKIPCFVMTNQRLHTCHAAVSHLLQFLTSEGAVLFSVPSSSSLCFQLMAAFIDIFIYFLSFLSLSAFFFRIAMRSDTVTLSVIRITTSSLSVSVVKCSLTQPGFYFCHLMISSFFFSFSFLLINIKAGPAIPASG